MVWFIAVIGTGVAANMEAWGLSASLAVLGISVGVPLMRAFTEHSK